MRAKSLSGSLWYVCKFVLQTSTSELINRIKVKKPVSEQDQTQFGMDVDVCFSKLILSAYKYADALTRTAAAGCTNAGDKTR